MTDQRADRSTPFDASGDALSDVLELIRLRGDDLAVVRSGDRFEARHHTGERMLHIVEQGPVQLDVEGEGELPRLERGDLVLLATGATHRMRVPDGGAWMSGRFLVEENTAAPLLAVLPPAVVIRGSDEGLEWLPLTAGVLAAESAEPTAGSRAMVSRLLDLLFILALRTWAELDDAPHPGWLTAALDRQLGPALTAMHRHPERPWTVEALAARASLSRAAFAARFVRLVGEPPARHLARLRLARAADLLATTSDPVGAVGRTVGFTSEAAFSRAFAREHGTPPREWRAAGTPFPSV
ncbi:cupin domain-containing protein [Myceligenerans indicum]|uniref:AraC family transcriptional regulator n=1 Tax=Myceligenerans indicum TaxID=2593663 RepID=A0ABS1LJ56_9MICO|nr:AraC family transcriptional regulator [Myceligenerans indicum]MBL0886231.1 AraC family transcriptional regulator [Myceligenerans indicum]